MFGFGKKKGPQAVSLNSDQFTFDVEPEQNILDAALKAGVPLPHNLKEGADGSLVWTLIKVKIKAKHALSNWLDGNQLKTESL